MEQMMGRLLAKIDASQKRLEGKMDTSQEKTDAWRK
jgi:hypothetical protein